MNNNPAHQPAERSGILAAGTWVIDHVKLIDRYPEEDGLALVSDEYRSNGGAPYNLLKDLSKMGAPFPLFGAGLIGDDEFGQFILAECRSHGIDTGGMRLTTAAATSYTDVMTVGSTGRRTFFHQKGTNALLDEHHFSLSRSEARILHLAYLSLMDKLDEVSSDGLNGSASILSEAQRLGMVTAADVVTGSGDPFRRAVLPALPFVDYLFLNETEAERLTGQETRKGGHIFLEGLYRAAEALIEGGVNTFVIIHFPEGCLAFSADGHEKLQGSVALPAELVSGAVGAGDAFAAGVLYGVHEEWQVDRSLELGVCAAAASLRHATSSEGLAECHECLELGNRYGFRALARK